MAGNVLAANAAVPPINTSRLVSLAILSSPTLLRFTFVQVFKVDLRYCNLKAAAKLLQIVEITKQ